MMCPFKFGDDTEPRMRWSKWIESLRKDVECVFGILKKRFMVLKYALRFRDIETIGKVFRTCCINNIGLGDLIKLRILFTLILSIGSKCRCHRRRLQKRHSRS
jgi:hypothetical protein